MDVPEMIGLIFKVTDKRKALYGMTGTDAAYHIENVVRTVMKEDAKETNAN